MRFSRPTVPSVLLLLSLAAAPATRPAGTPGVTPADQPAVKLDKNGEPNRRFLQMHDKILARGKAGPIGVLFLGDSITEFWSRAPAVWDEHYGKLDPANFGVSGDKTENVLWRIDHGELDGPHPKVVVLMIGTNNHDDSAAHIAAADEKIVAAIHAKLPDAKLLLLGVFPRGADPAQPATASLREKYAWVNARLAKLDDGRQTRYLDIGDQFLSPDGTLSPDVMPDALHPSPRGYQIWADAMQPLLDEMMR